MPHVADTRNDKDIHIQYYKIHGDTHAQKHINYVEKMTINNVKARWLQTNALELAGP